MKELPKGEFPETWNDIPNTTDSTNDSSELDPEDDETDALEEKAKEQEWHSEEEKREISAPDAWKKIVCWNADLQKQLCDYVRRLGEVKGKHDFLNDMIWKDVEWLDLFHVEYPDEAQRRFPRRSQTPQEAEPDPPKPTYTYWLDRINWNQQLRSRYARYTDMFDFHTAKRLFLKELSTESAEMEELYTTEFPETN
jgi:hypothetical protein